MWFIGIRIHEITPILSDERPPVGAGGPRVIDPISTYKAMGQDPVILVELCLARCKIFICARNADFLDLSASFNIPACMYLHE